jgi:hypothetical protein
MEDNAKQDTDAGPHGKPQADLIGGFLWLRVFLLVGHAFPFILF